MTQVLAEANEGEPGTIDRNISLEQLIERVTQDAALDIEYLISSKRGRKITNARAVISYLAAIKLRYNGAQIANALRLSGKSISRCIERGKVLLDNNEKMLQYLQ